MRSEQFGRLRRRAERDHATVGPAGSSSNCDPAQPWPLRTKRRGIAQARHPLPHSHQVGGHSCRRWNRATCPGTQPHLNCRRKGTRDRSHGSRKHPRKSQDSSGSFHSRQVAREVHPSAWNSMHARCARNTACRFAPLQPPVRRHHLHLRVEGGSGTSRRARRRSTSGNDISSTRAVGAFGCVAQIRKMRKARWGRATDSGGPSNTQSCCLP